MTPNDGQQSSGRETKLWVCTSFWFPIASLLLLSLFLYSTISLCDQALSYCYCYGISLLMPLAPIQFPFLVLLACFDSFLDFYISFFLILCRNCNLRIVLSHMVLLCLAWSEVPYQTLISVMSTLLPPSSQPGTHVFLQQL